MDEISKAIWFPFNDEPVLTGSWYVPKFCDPQVLMPNQSPDKKWHMFLHSWIGIHHFVSDSGIAWEPKKMIVLRGHYPHIHHENGVFYLLYEKHDYNIPSSFIRRADENNENCSRIEMRTSEDLVSWSKSRVLLDSEDIPYAKDYVKRACISRPQIVKIDGVYNLYFGASEVLLADSKMKVSRYLGCATSDKLDGQFKITDSKPLLEPNPDDNRTNLATGSVSFLACNEKLYAFQCGYFWDEQKRCSASALYLLVSDDGKTFKTVSDKSILSSQSEGWTKRYIKGCKVCYKQDEKCWYCYYSATGQNNTIFSKESVGLLIGNNPEQQP